MTGQDGRSSINSTCRLNYSYVKLKKCIKPVEKPPYHPRSLPTVSRKAPSDYFGALHVFWASVPVSRSPLAASHVERSFLPVLYLLPLQLCSSCHHQPADCGSQANRRSTQWTRRIIFVEGRDWDRLSHNSPHHQYFTPFREPRSDLCRLLSAQFRG